MVLVVGFEDRLESFVDELFDIKCLSLHGDIFEIIIKRSIHRLFLGRKMSYSQFGGNSLKKASSSNLNWLFWICFIFYFHFSIFD